MTSEELQNRETELYEAVEKSTESWTQLEGISGVGLGHQERPEAFAHPYLVVVFLKKPIAQLAKRWNLPEQIQVQLRRGETVELPVKLNFSGPFFG
jgi:hypothetical protein